MDKTLIREKRALYLIIKCHDLIMRAKSEEDILNNICSLLVDTNNYSLVWIGIPQEGRSKKILPVSQYGFKKGYLESSTINWGDPLYSGGTIDLSIKTCEPQINQDAHNNPAYKIWRKSALEYGYKSSISLPCIADEDILFVLNIYSSEPHAFEVSEVELLEMLSKDIAYGVQNIRIRIERDTDKLTGLANRRYFDETINKEWKRAIRHRDPITLLMIDIDFFKEYNDSYGHLPGDQCLKKVSYVLNKIISRPGDLVARYGGEEFAVILPNSGTNAIAVADKCRSAIENLGIKHKKSKISDFVTISVGASTMVPELHSSFLKVIESADQSLYQAKKSGRNRVCSV